MTVVVDHDARRLVWAAPGRDKATLQRFFDLLGPDRCARITQVSADAADWIAAVVDRCCPQAVRCADAFHVVAVRHEAHVYRTEVRDHRRRAVVAVRRSWGQPDPGGAGEGGKRP